jgi:hypothetical protein
LLPLFFGPILEQLTPYSYTEKANFVVPRLQHRKIFRMAAGT